jgi:hypothetical protein
MKLMFPKIDPKNGLKAVKTFATNNAAELCAATAILSMGAVIICSIKGTKKCIDEIDRAKILKNTEFFEKATKHINKTDDIDDYDEDYEDDEEEAERTIDEDDAPEYQDLTKKEKFVIYTKCYWPVALFTGLSVGSMLMALKFKNKQIKAAMIAASMAETALASKESTVASILSARQAKDAVMAENKAELEKNKAPEAPFIERSAVPGDTLMYDPLFKRYFYSDIEQIRGAINDAREEFNDAGGLTINDFYMHLGIKTVECGDEIGWEYDRTGPMKCELEYDPDVNGRPTVVLKHKNLPQALIWNGKSRWNG